ncbi:hypothetical protein Tco_0450505 [Tanacetum coccineum]
MARQCTQPKRPRNAAWYKEKAMLAEAQEAGQILDEEQLAFLVDPGIPAAQAQTIIPHNVAFQTEDLDTYDSNCDDLSTAQAVLMANISNYGSDIILEAQQDSMILSMIEQMSEQMSEQMINHVNNWEKANEEQNNKSITVELKRYKEMVKTFEQRLNIDLSSRKKMIDSQMDDMIREKLALKEQIDSLEQNLSKQIKEKESLFKTNFTVDVPSELPKVSLVNASLKKIKFHLTQFDSVVKKRTTLSALEEDIFNVLDKDLLNEITEVQTVFDQIEAYVQQFSVDKKCLEIDKKEILLENDRLLQKIMSQCVLITVMNSMSLNNNSINMEMLKCDLCEKCLNLDAELSKSKQAYNDLLKNHSKLKQHYISLEVSMQLKQEVFQNDEFCVNQNAVEIQEYFEIKDLKAWLQDKDKTIYKLKDTIKSLRENTKEENVNHDRWEIKPINKELENSVVMCRRVVSENWSIRRIQCSQYGVLMGFPCVGTDTPYLLCWIRRIEVFKDQFDSIKQTRVLHKEQSDSLTNKLHLKSVEIEDLKAQIQDTVFVITSLKNDL